MTSTLHPDALYHLATGPDWERYAASGQIAPPSLATEGFVHCSWGRQVPGTVEKHFAEETHLVALEIDPGALGDVRLVEEDSYGSGQSFPHIYEAIPVGAVRAIVPIG